MLKSIYTIEILQNRILWTAIIANILAQTLKIFTSLATEKKINLKRIFETGGMPSSHSAIVVALATGIGMEKGFNSEIFALAANFSLILLFDATGIRRAAGEHAELLNLIIEDSKNLFTAGLKPKQLKTFLGHTWIQVIAGTLLGIVTAVITLKWIWPPNA